MSAGSSSWYRELRKDVRGDAGRELNARLIREFGVAALPGETFGIDDRCALRISYGALDRTTVAEGIGRLVRGLQAIIGGEPRS